VASAAPDGYTLFLGSPINISPVFLKNNAVDAGKELSPVSRVYTSPFMVFVSAKQPFKSWADIVAYAKANPGKANFGTVASLTTLLMGVLKTRSGIDYTVIPYKANADLIKAMTVGDVDFTVLTPPPFLSSLQAGTVRALFGTQRFALLPNVPSAADAGIPNFDLVTNGGIWAPHDTPRDVVQKLSTAVAAAAKAPDIIEQSRKNFGLDIVSTTPAEELHNYQTEMRFWEEAARLANFQPE
jgi:tripartite-type tricarboxylate transporter receptor subunit TctC